MSNKVSIKFIAEKTGFSVSTISRVMNGRAREYRISETAEKKIKKAVKEFGYKPNPIAVNLRVKKSFTVGLIIPSLDNPFFVKITGILNRELVKRGYNIVVTESDEDPLLEEKLVKQLLTRNIDGLLLIPCRDREENITLLEDTINNGVPVLCIDRYIENSAIPYIISNNLDGAYEGVKFLVEKGHKKIACIQGLEDSTPSIDRKKGFLKALAEDGLKAFYIGGDEFTVECGYREMNKILKMKEKPTAIFAMSSTIALGIMKAIEENGYSIPKDFSLIGFDDNIFLDYLATPLTSIAQPIEEISEKAAHALINLIDGEIAITDWENKILETHIIHRKSVN